MPRYGRKCGDGPTRGKRAVKYRFPHPIGIPGFKSSYLIDQPQAFAVLHPYKHAIGGYVATLWATENEARNHMAADGVLIVAERF